jgi:chemotaxis protein CheX
MSIEMPVDIVPGKLAQIVESVFATMMSLEVGEGGPTWYPSADRLTSAVHLAGDWNGTVLVECDRSQACRFAGRFLSVSPPDTVTDMVRDVLGELTNMIGGNLKCVLTQGVSLSTPCVVDGGADRLWIGGDGTRVQHAFQCVEGAFWITVFNRYPPGLPS